MNWYTNFSDGDFVYGRALSQLTGTLLLRLADAPVLPFQFTDTANTLERYVGELEVLAKGRNDASVDVAPLRTAVDALGRAARNYEDAYQRVGSASSSAIGGRADLRQLNKMLLQSERKLGNDSGLPRREWFKHQVYAPGFYTGYGVKTMPQIREGLEENRPDEAREGVRKVAASIDALAAQIDQAAALLKKTVP